MKVMKRIIIKFGSIQQSNYILWYENKSKLFMYSDNEYNHASSTNLNELKKIVKEIYNINILN